MASAIQGLLVCITAVLVIIYSGKAPLISRKVTELIHGKTGCAPVPAVENVTLHYFAVRGRAEPIRLILEEAGITYSEVIFNRETWPEKKKEGIQSGLYTFGQVPAIESSTGVRMSQSLAIAHYLGRATGMECDCEDMHFCEIVANGVDDVKAKYAKLVYNPYTVKDRESFLLEEIPMWLGHFEKIAPLLSKQSDAYFASNRVTWVDFFVYDLLERCMDFGLFNFDSPSVVQKDVLVDFPKLGNFYRQMSSRPKIAKYRMSKKRFPFVVQSKPQDLAPGK